MDRREFLRKAYQVGGLAALYNLGLSNSAVEAFMRYGGTTVPSAAGGQSWADWDEETQGGADGLATDQDDDGTDDTFYVVAAATGAGDDETGEGVVTGADLVWTENGNIAAAGGSPAVRVLDGTDDYFAVTQNFLDTMLSGTTFTVIIKFTSVTAGVGKLFINISGATNKIYVRFVNAATLMEATMNSSVGSNGPTNSVNNIPTATNLWVCIWGDGSANSKVGWDQTKPTAKTDFAANDTIDMGNIHNFGSNTWATVQYIFADNGPANYLGCSWQYAVFSNICLFT